MTQQQKEIQGLQEALVLEQEYMIQHKRRLQETEGHVHEKRAALMRDAENLQREKTSARIDTDILREERDLLQQEMKQLRSRNASFLMADEVRPEHRLTHCLPASRKTIQWEQRDLCVHMCIQPCAHTSKHAYITHSHDCFCMAFTIIADQQGLQGLEIIDKNFHGGEHSSQDARFRIRCEI